MYAPAPSAAWISTSMPLPSRFVPSQPCSRASRSAASKRSKGSRWISPRRWF